MWLGEEQSEEELCLPGSGREWEVKLGGSHAPSAVLLVSVPWHVIHGTDGKGALYSYEYVAAGSDSQGDRRVFSTSSTSMRTSAN